MKLCKSSLYNFQNPGQGQGDLSCEDHVSVLAVWQQQHLFSLPVYLLLQIAMESLPKPLNLVWDLMG